MLKRHPIHPRQYGAALLILLLMFMALGIALIAYSTDPDSIEVARQQKTYEALAAAKEAVLAFAATQRQSDNYSRPGELPRPDANQDGVSDTAGGNNPLIGWFPWKTLETQELTDASGAHLWYVVSPDFYNRTGAAAHNEPIINPGSIGQLDFAPENDIVAAAIIIAPGAALSSQTRSANDDDADQVIQQYLEGENSDPNNLFRFTGVETAGMNDHIMIITVDEIMRVASRSALSMAQDALQHYYNTNHFYPYAEFDTRCDLNTATEQKTVGLLPMWADAGCPYEVIYDEVKAAAKKPEDLGYDPGYKGLPDWFDKNEWYKYIVYAVAPACAGSATNNCDGAGFLRLGVTVDIHALVIDAGIELNGIQCSGQPPYDQSRAALPLDICAYLETDENTDYDNDYVQTVSSTASNDRFVIVDP
ncbi:MAG TPA: hypothetical protein VFX02_11880 [Gammaproteobacteria bacterium]|nr:hypothetical protein [Gammaproteobacteria bacterium]